MGKNKTVRRYNRLLFARVDDEDRAHLDTLCREWPTTISLFMRGAIRREWRLRLERKRHTERRRAEAEETEETGETRKAGGNTDTEQDHDETTISETEGDDAGRDARDPYVALDG